MESWLVAFAYFIFSFVGTSIYVLIVYAMFAEPQIFDSSFYKFALHLASTDIGFLMASFGNGAEHSMNGLLVVLLIKQASYYIPSNLQNSS